MLRPQQAASLPALDMRRDRRRGAPSAPQELPPQARQEPLRPETRLDPPRKWSIRRSIYLGRGIWKLRPGRHACSRPGKRIESQAGGRQVVPDDGRVLNLSTWGGWHDRALRTSMSNVTHPRGLARRYRARSSTDVAGAAADELSAVDVGGTQRAARASATPHAKSTSWRRHGGLARARRRPRWYAKMTCSSTRLTRRRRGAGHERVARRRPAFLAQSARSPG